MGGCDRRLKMNFGDGSGRTRHASSDLKNKLCRSALLAAYGEMRHDENRIPENVAISARVLFSRRCRAPIYTTRHPLQTSISPVRIVPLP